MKPSTWETVLVFALLIGGLILSYGIDRYRVGSIAHKRNVESRIREALEDCQRQADILQLSSDVIIWYYDETNNEYWCGIIGAETPTPDKSLVLKGREN